MSDLSNLLLLLVLGAVVGLWLKLSAARERAMREARRFCLQHGLQLLDETVGLRRVRLRRIDGLRRVERCYAFDVSVDGKDRQPGRLWMIGHAVTSLSLPTTEPPPEASIARSVPLAQLPDNVVPLHPPSRQNQRLH